MNAVPEAAVEAAAKVMLGQYDREYDASRFTWHEFADDAREILAAAWAAWQREDQSSDGPPYSGQRHPGVMGRRAP